MSDFLSSFGPLILGIVGFAFFGPLGFAVGSMVGSLLFRPDTPTIEGPSLQDRLVQKSEYGAHLPVVWGRMRTAGNIVWVKGNQIDEQIRKIKQGGQKIRMRYYYGTFLVLLADCPDGVGIDGIEKIWLNNELVYDFGNQQTFDPTTGTLYEFLAATKQPGIQFRVLDGTQTTADDLISADLGAGNAPAYTRRAGILFVDLPLEKYGNQIPKVECLVVRKCTASYPATVDLDPGSALTGGWHGGEVDQTTGYIWYISNTSLPCEVSVIDPVSETVVARINLGLVDQPIWDGEDVVGIGIDYIERTAVVICYPGWTGGETQITGTYRIDIDLDTYQIVGSLYVTVPYLDPILYKNGGFFMQATQTAYLFGGHTTIGFVKAGVTTVASGPTAFYSAQELARWQDSSGKIYTRPVWLGPPESDVPPTMDNGNYWCVVTMTDYIRIYQAGWVLVANFHAAEWTSQGAPKWCWDYTRNYLYCWDPLNVGSFIYRLDLNDDLPTAVKIDLSHNCDGLGYDGESDTLFVGNNAGLYVYRASDFTLIDSRTGISATGELYAPPTAAGWVVRNSNLNKIYYHQQFTGAPSLATVVGDSLATISDFTPDDYDVSDLTQIVQGYASGPAVRGTIEPLRQLYRFDLVEIDHQLVAVNRGGAPAHVIAWDDLGATVKEAATAIKITRRQEVELPKHINLTLLDPALDYQANTQRATKIQTQSDNQVDINLPIVMGADNAAQAVDVLLHQDWLSRTGYEIILPPKYAHIAPSDVLSIPMDEDATGYYTLLASEVSVSPEGLVTVRGVREQPDVYTSTVTGTAGSYTPQAVIIPYPSRLELLDINPWTPLTGYFVAVCGTRLPWPGADVLESAALSGPYDAIVTTQDAAVLGSAVTALASASPWRTDYDNSVTVRLADPAAVLTSGLALLGDEIIHFSSAVQSGQEWTLSTLLRGRKGTDTGMTHAAGERFVLLDDNVISIAQPVSELGVSHYFRAVTKGQREETISPVTFANGFNCLKPWSPKQAVATIGRRRALPQAHGPIPPR
ncbi:MAG: hypothetical protein A2Y38_00430 [Spirochaetes bacterium GWB1_59_5]|nr:MAG: hypothetical protein A2Y38_00430 [Spirochaetes bacterium GWB1_59_5]